MSLFRLMLASAVVLPLIGGGVAFAQQIPAGGSAGTGGFSPPVHGNTDAVRRRAPEPPGLPGTSAKPGETAAGVQTDLAPTEALFDSINRGDVTEARDALGRGADINGHNVLGMTPLDLSIDLSRNDITFLLLSMRSQGEVGGPPAASASAKLLPQHQAAAKTRSGARLAAARSGNAATAQATIVGQRPFSRTDTSATPARYAGSGGTPIPQMGFLGFGNSNQP